MNIKLIHSARRKRVTLRFTSDRTLEVLAPPGFSMSDAERLISNNRNVVERLRQQAELLHQKRPQLSADSKLLYLGELFFLIVGLSD